MTESGPIEIGSFLAEVTKNLKRSRPVRIPRKETIALIARISKSRNPAILFEEWESYLRKPVLVGNWSAFYSVYSDSLVLEYIPDWSQIERAIDIRGGNLPNELENAIRALSAQQFPYFLANLFSRVQWASDVLITKQSHDGGVDFQGYYVYHDSGKVPLFGQAKHWKSKVGSDPIRTFIGSVVPKSKGRACMGLYVCTAGFSLEAEKEIENAPFKLLKYDLFGLVKLMVDSRVGVRSLHLESLRLDGSFWDEILF